MIHLVHAANRHLYAAQLENMFRQRHELFVVERGWKALDRGDGLDCDVYDDDQACYLLGLDRKGDMIVSVRLRPTATGGVLPDHFPEFVAPCEGEIRGETIWEITRYCTIKGHRGAAGFTQRSSLNLAAMELLVQRRATRAIGLTDVALVAAFRVYSGLQVRPLGFPGCYEEGEALAFEAAVGEEALAAARRRLTIHTPQLFDAPAHLPASVDVHALEQAFTLITAGTEGQRPVIDFVRAESAKLEIQKDVPALMERLAQAA